MISFYTHPSWPYNYITISPILWWRKLPIPHPEIIDFGFNNSPRPTKNECCHTHNDSTHQVFCSFDWWCGGMNMVFTVLTHWRRDKTTHYPIFHTSLTRMTSITLIMRISSSFDLWTCVIYRFLGIKNEGRYGRDVNIDQVWNRYNQKPYHEIKSYGYEAYR